MKLDGLYRIVTTSKWTSEYSVCQVYLNPSGASVQRPYTRTKCHQSFIELFSILGGLVICLISFVLYAKFTFLTNTK